MAAPETLGQIFLAQCEKYADKPAYLVPGKKEFTPITYADTRRRVFESARALWAMGLRRGDMVVIVSENGIEWCLFDWACQTLGLVAVPIYPTLPPDQTQYIVRDCGAKLYIAQNDKQADKVEGLTELRVERLPSEGQSDGYRAFASESNLTEEMWVHEATSGGREDLATLIYTSGTTGHPKGVMLPHRCFTSLLENIPKTIPIDYRDTFLNFLPLSHVFARFVDHILSFGVGATTAFIGSLATMASDMERVKPTIMAVVPRLLESVRTKIVEKVEKDPPFRRSLFQMALTQGLAKQRRQFAPLNPILNRLVGDKVRARFGGRLRFFVSGGAALPPVVSEFYLALGVGVLQGYGLTETCAASALNLPDDNSPETVGPPITGVETTIAPDGEILIRGASVMSGYFNLPEDTAAAIDGEGWFHTGDIGELRVDGKLRITDRKKDLIVLGNGKNVAPQPIENKLKESPYINEAVLIGDGMEGCVALIVPEFEKVTSWLNEQGVNVADPAEMAVNDSVKALIKSEVDKTNKTLADFERVKRHELVTSPFTIDGGELTPSLKVRRRVVKEKYSDLIDRMKR
ncbi:MAG: long-chain fatty acid--CoA ligase [Fimbriimonadaceae bacterium]|nr:long-chain fatty acid--CoA ligase [Fimbriimonadaceae bacterium]